MRAFGVASVFIVLLAAVGGFGLHLMQVSSSSAYSTVGTRLDQGEAADFYAREVKPEAR